MITTIRAERDFSEFSQETKRRRKLKSPGLAIYNIATLSTVNSTPDRMEDGSVYALDPKKEIENYFPGKSPSPCGRGAVKKL